MHVHEGAPLENLLHLFLFVAGATVIGAVALAVLERLAGGGGPPRVGAKHVLIPLAVATVALGAEVAFHLTH